LHALPRFLVLILRSFWSFPTVSRFLLRFCVSAVLLGRSVRTASVFSSNLVLAARAVCEVPLLPTAVRTVPRGASETDSSALLWFWSLQTVCLPKRFFAPQAPVYA